MTRKDREKDVTTTDLSVASNGNQPARDRDKAGRFAPGNKLAPGGPRPRAGRKPKPQDPGLIQQLYELLDQSAPLALEVVNSLLQSKNDRVRLRAAELILKKVLPDRSTLDVEARVERPYYFAHTKEEEEIMDKLARELIRVRYKKNRHLPEPTGTRSSEGWR